MNRSGYSDDCDNWDLIRWRGAVKQAIRGARGQAMLRELVQALDALPAKRLVAGKLVTEDGDYCALGALGRARGMDMARIDPEDSEAVARAFGVARALAAETMYMNDEMGDNFVWYFEIEVCGPMRPWLFERHKQTLRFVNERAAEDRWQRMREWAVENLKTPND